MIRKFFKAATLWLWGGCLWYIIEMLYRGRSHESMFIVAGFIFLLLDQINEFLPWELGLVWQALIGALIVTVIELISGLVLNIWLGLGVWDYSSLPFNLAGQICLQFSLTWIPVSAFGICLADYLNYLLFNKRNPHYSIIQIRPAFGRI